MSIHGAFKRFEELAEKMNVSRSPVREALKNETLSLKKPENS